MEQIAENKMAKKPLYQLILTMGVPMILSMILQSVYNIVDTIFVINMPVGGTEGNLALTFAFPIQILIIAIGVGTGVGINVLLSKSIGEGNKERTGQIIGNGLFLAVVIYAVFLLFGIFGVRAFIGTQTDNETAIEMGTTYLQICCLLSFGCVGFPFFERYLMAAGRTGLSMAAQMSGAATNILLDYVFIFPCGMGVAGAAWATVIGQIVSLTCGAVFHYTLNKEGVNGIRYLRPSGKIIRGIYRVGISAVVMQGMLAVMMFGMNLILGTARDGELLQGTFGIYYKIMQFALFAALGLSNALISIVAFNYGMKSATRIRSGLLWGLVYSVALQLLITALFQALAVPLSRLFGMTGGDASEEIISACVTALRIASIGYVFMGFTVGMQGVLQGLGYSVRPMILSLLRLAVFVFPIAYLFTLTQSPVDTVWWAFPISEFLTALVAAVMILRVKQKIKSVAESAAQSEAAAQEPTLQTESSEEEGAEAEEPQTNL